MKSKQAAVVDEFSKTVAENRRRDLSRKREPNEMGIGTLDDLISGTSFV